jgi:hypothetical protein
VFVLVSSLAVLDPAEKNVSSKDATEPDPRLLDASLPLPPGGGVTTTSARSDEPLETVTGEPPRTTRVMKPSPGRASRARLTADANASSRFVREMVRLREL